ncbi:hypothetical protein JW898_05850 [Candidatus Woesearchaeota archaeon]|nr:hypothetical protein [Candidatus Woesearchaeota archaeon]
MRRFEKEEMGQRSKIVALCHSIYQLFNEKRKELAVDWKEEFNKGGVERVEQLFNRTLEVVYQQISAVSQLSELIRQQDAEVRKSAGRLGKHLDYASLVKSHFSFATIAGEMIKKEELDTEKLLELLRKLFFDLSEQKKKLDSVKKQGAGKQAYAEVDIRSLAQTEFKILQSITPFWNEWETLVPKIEALVSNIGQASEEDLDRLKKDIRKLLDSYHKSFANDEQASQLGTELALNLAINDTKEMDALGGKVPVAIVNVDMTACNSLDTSHKLGDALIQTAYKELDRRLRREFTIIEQYERKGIIDGKGVVTILGRTRLKIVGIGKKEIEDALKEVPPIVRKQLVDTFSGQFQGADLQSLKNLNTRLLAGYHELDVGNERRQFVYKLVYFKLTSEGYLKDIIQPYTGELDAKVERESALAELKELEKQIAQKIDDAIKHAAAKAEYLEKMFLPDYEGRKLGELKKRMEEEHIPPVETPVFVQRINAIEREVLADFPAVVIYDGKFEPKSAWIGLNYIPEEEFEGKMINRVAHQIGLDNHLAEELLRLFHECRQKRKDGKLEPEDAKKLHELKEKFYLDVLQKRHLAKSYDLRFPASLREDSFDQVLAAMTLIEGPQVMTFFELDGFNAFNKLYRPDKQDTYYHSVLKMMLTHFDEVFNEGVAEQYAIKPRMVKQGDEIWISYPLTSERGKVSEKEHMKFLERVRRSLVSLSLGEALKVPNQRTIDWIPLRIDNKILLHLHLQNCFRKSKQVFYVDNSKFTHDRPQSEKHIEVTPLNQEGLFGSYFTMVRIIGANKKEDFTDWKSISPAREVTGDGDFGPEKFIFSSMLFEETVKLLSDGASSRLKTGRVIRLGTTAGYAGFSRPLMPTAPKESELIRGRLNEAVEKMRHRKGRGGIYNLEKEGFAF